jgi:hypothetical protein
MAAKVERERSRRAANLGAPADIWENEEVGSRPWRAAELPPVPSPRWTSVRGGRPVAAKTVYVFLDSCIYNRFLTQGQPGCEPEHFQKVEELITTEAACLLLPEIVQLEVEKFWSQLEDDFNHHFEKAAKSLATVGDGIAKDWNEMGDVKGALLAALDEKRRQKTEAAKPHYQRVQELFRLPSVASIPFTHEVLLRGNRRMIAGKLPYEPEANAGKKPDRRDRESDACIIESIKGFFEAHSPDGAALYFCSENVKDFGHVGKDGPYIAAAVREGLPEAVFFTDLKGLVEYAKDPKEIQNPTPEEEKKDVEKERQEQIERQERMERQAKAVQGILRHLEMLRSRHIGAPPFGLDVDSQDAAFNAYYRQPRPQFPWQALYPTPPHQAFGVPDGEVIVVDPLLPPGPPTIPATDASIDAAKNPPTEERPT